MAVKIWVDNDACPHMIKQVIYKAAKRLQLEVYLVANRPGVMAKASYIHVVQVPQGADIADQYIIDKVDPQDVVITADIPLADAVVTKSSTAINPRGYLYTHENIKERLAVRDFMTQMREQGAVQGGPSAFGLKDKERFANALDRTLTQKVRQHQS